MKHDLNPTALYWASFDRFSLRLPGECVQDIAQSGSRTLVCQWWAQDKRINWAEMNLRGEVQTTPDAIRAELKEYGAWDADQLQDDAENRVRLLWVAAWNIAEDDAPDCSEPLVPSGEVGPFANIGI